MVTEIPLEVLGRLDPVPPPAVLAADAFRSEMQALTSSLASDPLAWTDEVAARVASVFGARAASWGAHRSPGYLAPLADAVARGGVGRGGTCLEVGSGTGLQTPTLLGHFDVVVALDIAAEMLERAGDAGGTRLQADAAALPLSDGSLDAVVCVNAFLFTREYLRVLRPGGVVVFVSTRAAATPIYLAPAAVLSALVSAAPERVRSASTSGVAESCWTVVRC